MRYGWDAIIAATLLFAIRVFFSFMLFVVAVWALVVLEELGWIGAR